MLTYRDCLDLCNLTDAEIAAIAEHEHVPAIVAVELGNDLVVTLEGRRRIRRFILDDIAAAESRHDCRHADRLRLVLKHFCETYPDGGPVSPRALA